jgi:hypothetical protein
MRIYFLSFCPGLKPGSQFDRVKVLNVCHEKLPSETVLPVAFLPAAVCGGHVAGISPAKYI